MKRKTALSTIVISVLLFSLVVGLQFVGASSKTIVVPNDYPTIQEAIDNASEGTTVFVKSGTYSDLNLTINKSISLIGENSQTTTLQGQKPLSIQPLIDSSKNQSQFTQTLTQLTTQSNAKSQADFCNFVSPYPQTSITITVNAPNISISGFTITNADVCIQVNSYNTYIFGNNLAANDYALSLSGNSNKVENNTITGNKAVFSVGSSNVIVKNYINCYVGIELYSNSNIVSDNIFQTGSAITVSSALGYTGGSHVISNNIITGKGNGHGISLGVISPNNSIFANNITKCDVAFLFARSSYNSIYANYISNCNSAIALVGEASLDPELPYSPKNNTFYHNSFVNNTLNVETRDDNFLETSNGTKNYWDNGKEGNFWSNYNGTDANHDGIGDAPYIIDVKRQDNFPLTLPFDTENNIIQLPLTTPTPTPSLSPIIYPTNSPTQQPPSSSTPPLIGDPGVDMAPTLIMLGVLVMTIILGVVAYFYFKKKLG